jgi:hypothetical protein
MMVSMAVIVRVQAMVRAFLARRRFKREIGHFSQSNGNYFRREEFYETILEGSNFQNAPIKNVRYDYKCSPNTYYEGQMKGGFRHGMGKMTWADGAIYNGEWKEGYACGHGVFTHAEGDIYDGNWMNNKCNGKGIYHNKMGARYEGDWVDDI